MTISRFLFSPYKVEGFTHCNPCPLLPRARKIPSSVITKPATVGVTCEITCGAGFTSTLVSNNACHPLFWGSKTCKLTNVTIALEEERDNEG